MNLKEIRKEKGFTQKDLADAIGVDISSISKYETGVSFPSMEVTRKLADVLGVSADRIIGREMTDDDEVQQLLREFKDNPELKILFDKVKNCTPEELKALMAVHTAMRNTNPNFRDTEG